MRPRLNEQEYKSFLEWQYLKHKNKEQNRVLVIPDLHAPFIYPGFLDFCLEVQKKYETNKTVFIGDIIDNHYSSYHETDPDGHSAAMELERAKEQIHEFYSCFPVADVLIGNHDAIPARKAMTAGLSNKWIKTINEVLELGSWSFHERLYIDNVLYVHGVGMKADQRMLKEHTSVVQGHYHSEGYINWSVGRKHKFFAMQLGAGIDRKAYAFAYGKHFPKNHLNCGVVIDGKEAHLEYMDI